jgi:hypothetical protein
VTGLHETNSWFSFLIDAKNYEKDVPKLKNSLKTQESGFFRACKNILSHFRTVIYLKWNKKTPEQSTREFEKSPQG